MFKRILSVLIFINIMAVTSVVFCEEVTGDSSDKNKFRHVNLVEAVKIKSPLVFCGENVPVDDSDVRERLEMELLLMAGDQAQTILWMKRAGRYFPHIENTLKTRGIPDDLKYIAIIESSLRSGANSGAGASGFWQFMESTGKKYGLDINPGIDTRRNFVISTDAALNYLSSLHSMFGAWSLAAAAYNMGENGLRDRIANQETRDYYKLYLPNETMRYVIRAIAVKTIFENPARFGFNLEKTDMYLPVETEQVKIDCPFRINIMLLAKAANTYYKTIRELNPEIKGAFIEKGSYSILLPKGSSSGFGSKFSEALKDNNMLHFYGVKSTYIVKQGESLDSIATLFGVKTETLKKWNGFVADVGITTGKKLTVYERF